MEPALRILHLEDDPVDTALALRRLRVEGLAAALDRVDSLPAFREALGQPYALILSDYAMPAMDPLEALALARQVRPELPFIFLSGTLGEEAAIETLKLGATDYVLKHRIESLAPAVRRALQVSEEQAQRRRAEEAQRAAEAQLRLITDAVPALIAYVDTEFRYRLANQTYQRWFGWDPALIRGRPVREVLGEEIWEVIRPRMERALAGEVVAYEHELPASCDGPRWVHVTYTPDLGEDGRARGFVVLVHDVSEAKRAADALRAANGALSEANAKLAEADRRKDEFLAMLAHELRNPLAPIRYAAQMLSMSELEAARLKKQCEVIDRQVSHMGRLLDDLLDVSRITRGKIQLKREQIDFRTVIDRALESLRPLIEGRGQHVAYQGPSSPLLVDGDPTRLEQIVRNLLHNANKYTEAGGCIGVSAGVEAENERMGWAVVSVHDSGVGIAPEILGQVFEPFVQAEQSLARTQGGLGIGLAMVKRLVQMHGGRVEARSAGVGRGSEFVVHLPLVEFAAVENHAARVLRIPSGSCRVLVAEDNVDSAASLSELLRLWGYEARAVHDGPQALAAARAWTPEVILLDIGLPVMDGYQVARNLRREPATASSFLVALTGYGAEEDRRRAEEAGFNQHLTKPVEVDRLQAILSDRRAA